jgi:hypothetical protein
VKFTVNKLEAARRQLRLALRLFFQEEDPLSTFTLNAAAHGILRDLLHRQGAPEASLIKDSDWIRPERKKEYLAIINRSQNFLKHADTDPDTVIEFDPEELPLWLVDSNRMYSMLTNRLLGEGMVFLAWFMVAYPQYIKPGPVPEAVARIRSELQAPTDRSLYLPLLGQKWPNTD